MKIKTPSFSNIIFILILALLLIPQTRTPIQVAVNKLKVLVWSPSLLDSEEQSQLPAFTYQLNTLDDDNREIAIGQGKVTFISYWATWCPPCIAELPSIEKLYIDYGEQVNFILLTDEDPETVRKFLTKKSFDLPVYFPQMETPKALYDASIPTTYVIDAAGRIIIKETGAADWNSEKVRALIEGLLKK